VIGTPIDLSRIVNIKHPYTRVHYDLQSIGEPSLENMIEEFVSKLK
jgi:predicted GTPase